MKQGQRLKLWEVRNGAHCSVIGTCLAPADVKAVLRKAKLQCEPGAPEYEVHGFLVNEAGRPGPVGRIIDACLDKKYAGAIRQSLRLEGEDAILAYWQEACRRGAIAGPYWALQTLPDLPQKLSNRIFGDVHMLGHFMAGASREQQAALWAALQRNQELEQRLQKARTRAEEKDLAQRARIDVLERELASARAATATSITPMPARNDASARQDRRLAKQGRRIAALREQVTRLQATNGSLRATLAERDRLPPLPSRLADLARHQPPERPAACRVAMLRSLLYVGGRPSALPFLRADAARIDAELLHHDGGIEENVTRLDELVPQADVVFCPVDCVSHGASLRARALCRRHAKPFVPLRSASASCFRRGIDQLIPQLSTEEDTSCSSR